MASRRSPASPSTSTRATSHGALVWLALGWLIVAAWLALLGVNAAPYLSGRPWPSASELLPRLIALPTALSLPPSLAAQAAWLVAAVALFLAVVVIALTLSPTTRALAVSGAADTADTPAPTPDAQLSPPSPPRSPVVTTLPGVAREPATEPAPPMPDTPAAEEAPVAPSQRPRVFISHSSADDAFGRALEQRLKLALGDARDVFYDRDDGLMGSDEWLKRLQYEIGQRNVFVLILSPSAFASGWVERELSYALRQAVSVGGKVIVPVLHRETEVWPFLADYQMVDFRAPDRFDAAFAELLAAVRLGYSRMRELRGLRGERRGPPFDIDRLPLPERFIGRGDDIEWALARLAPELRMDAAPVVDVGHGHVASGLASVAAANGLAGIGKSALAGALARILYATNRYPDGIAVIPCNDIHDPVTVLRATLARFDPEGRQPPEDTVEALSDLARQVFTQAPRALVILDNVERKLDIERVTKPLRVAGAALLLTSRHLLPASAVARDDCLQLDLLSRDEAIAVFIENRERAGQPATAATGVVASVDTPTDAERADIADIVEALGRHTLAVKLAAAHSRGRDLARLARDYAADPRLGVNLRVASEAVEVVMSSSVAARPASARQLFAALGAFASNDIGREALLSVGEALGDAEAEASLDVLLDARLADAYLDTTMPTAENGPDDAEDADRERLRLHPLTRAYARELLYGARTVATDPAWTPERRAQAERAMAAWYAEYVNETPRDALDPDEANIGGALAWAEQAGDDRLLAQLCEGLASYWETRGRTDARERYLPLALAAAQRLAETSGDREDRLLAARMELRQATLLQLLGDIPAARVLAERSVATRVALDDQRGEGIALSLLGDLALQEGVVAAARAAYERFLAIMQAVRDQRGEGIALSLLGDLALQEGDVAAARAAYERVLAIMQAVRDQREEGIALAKLGDLALQEGDVAAARAAYERYLAIMQAVRDQREEGIALSLLGDLALREGDVAAARAAYERYLAIMQTVRAPRSEGVALYKLAQVLELQGELDEAERMHRQSLEIGYRVHSPQDVADSLMELGGFLVRHGRGGDEGQRMREEAETIYARLRQMRQGD